jgi:hypothetical protein
MERLKNFLDRLGLIQQKRWATQVSKPSSLVLPILRHYCLRFSDSSRTPPLATNGLTYQKSETKVNSLCKLNPAGPRSKNEKEEEKEKRRKKA